MMTLRMRTRLAGVALPVLFLVAAGLTGALSGAALALWPREVGVEQPTPRAQQIAMELLMAQTGTRMTHVPYRGTAPAVTDLLSGNIQVMMTGAPAVLPHARAGTLRRRSRCARGR